MGFFYFKPMLQQILRTIKYRKIEILTLLVLIYELLFPYQVYAQAPQNSVVLPPLIIKSLSATDPVVADLADNLAIEKSEEITLVAPIKEIKVIKTYQVPVTAYSSTPDQTDGDPCTTANGFNVCLHNQEDVVAANFLKFGTKVRIPEHFGDQIFTVQDRMNARYNYHLDIWMKTREAAKKFGIVYTRIEVIE